MSRARFSALSGRPMPQWPQLLAAVAIGGGVALALHQGFSAWRRAMHRRAHEALSPRAKGHELTAIARMADEGGGSQLSPDLGAAARAVPTA